MIHFLYSFYIKQIFYSFRNQTAYEFYTKAVKLDQQHYEYYYNRASVLFKLRRYDQALRNAQKSLDLNPNFERNRSLFFDILAKQDSNETEIEESPDNVDELYEKATKTRLEEKYEKALELYTKALELTKSNGNDLNWIAEFNNQIGVCAFELKK